MEVAAPRFQAPASVHATPEAMMPRSPGGSSSSSSLGTVTARMRQRCSTSLLPGAPDALHASSELAVGLDVLLTTACVGLAGRALNRRQQRVRRQAVGKLVRPPLPPYMSEESSALVPQGSQEIFIHPASRSVEQALTSDSLRTLCKALASAAGSFLLIGQNLDRTRRPKMDQTLTIRALLRYCELRHSAGDDLQPDDFRGESGVGLRALLKHCRNYQLEVAAALRSNPDDAARMIRAFHDQAGLVKKYLPFFRTAVEQSMPALLRQTVEPLPRLISFLEPYGEVQLSFLFEAAKDKVFKASIKDMQPRHLLEVTDKWVSRARSGELAIVQCHKARVVVRNVASLDIELPPQERAVWMSLALWGSVLNMTEEVEIMEDRIRKGALYRGDPVEMLSLAEGMADVPGLSDEMFEMIQLPINQAIQRAGPQRAAEALASLTFSTGKLKKPADKATARLLMPERIKKKIHRWQRGEDRPFLKLRKKDPAGPPKPKEALTALIVKAVGFFLENVPLMALEYVLAKWEQKNFSLQECHEAARDHLLKCVANEENLVDTDQEDKQEAVPPGALARSGDHLLALGVPAYTLAPTVDWLLSHPVGWAEKRAFPQEATAEDAASIEAAMQARRSATGDLVKQSLPLLSHLWPEEPEEGQEDTGDLELFLLRDADELLRLVGPTEERNGKARKADVAADGLLQRLSAQLMFADLPAKAAVAMREWRETQPDTSLSTLVVPLVLEAAHLCAEQGVPEDRPTGVLSRSIELLARAINLEELSLQSAEWALVPFEAAGDSSTKAVPLVAASCAVGGVPQDVMAEACEAWLESGCPSGRIGLQLAKTSLQAWERDGVYDKGLEQLREVRSYLEAQLEKVAETSPWAAEQSPLRGAADGLALLVDAVDGTPPALAQLIKGREAILNELGGRGKAAFADAVALSWSNAMPGLPPSVAASHFEQWWSGQETRQELVARVASSGLQELSGRTQLRLQATFADQRRMEYSSPAWRVEGVQKVPWFLPTSVVEEAFQAMDGPNKRTRPGGFIGSKTAAAGAEGKSGGRCMYCGGGHKLRAKYFWPPELGGTDFVSNISACCELCSDMSNALGPRRWGEALSAEPEQAAEVWWEAQKKASMELTDVLGQNAE